MCGEKISTTTRRKPPGGSPPRVRGEAVKIVMAIPCNRITPACAGRRVLYLYMQGGHQDHPRVRGEKPRF